MLLLLLLRTRFVMQAVLLTQDVDIIVQHIKGVLQTLSKKHKPQAPKASNPDYSPMYGDKAVSGWCCTENKVQHYRCSCMPTSQPARCPAITHSCCPNHTACVCTGLPGGHVQLAGWFF